MDGRTIGRWGWTVLVLAASAAAVSVVACDSGPGGQASSGPTPRPTSASSTTEPTSALSSADKATQAAVTAYVGMWNDFAAAAATSDWRSPKLGQYATGLALSTLSRGLYADHANGVISKGGPTHDILKSSAAPPNAPTKVMITDCGDSTHWLQYRADNGQLADNTRGGHRLINATAQKQADGSWKVTDFGVHDLGSC